MPYNKLNLKNGDVLKAEHLNHIEEGFSNIAYNDLTDKPFGEIATGGDTLTWDGNTDGLVCVGDILYKISDREIGIGDLGNELKYYVPSEGATLNLEVTEAMPGLCLAVGPQNLAPFYFVMQDVVGIDLEGLTFLETGIYTVPTPGNVGIELTIPNYTGFPTTKKLDVKYLPDVSELPESWIAELKTALGI